MIAIYTVSISLFLHATAQNLVFNFYATFWKPIFVVGIIYQCGMIVIDKKFLVD